MADRTRLIFAAAKLLLGAVSAALLVVNLAWHGAVADPLPTGTGTGTGDDLAVETFGAVSATDNTALFQKAADALCGRTRHGGTIRLGAVVYAFAPKASITASCPITWQGEGWSEGVPNALNGAVAAGTWLRITADGSTARGGTSLFAIGPGQAGTTFDRLGVTEDQPAPPTGAGGRWAPIAYPVVFNSRNARGLVRFRDILAAPVYDLIASVDSGRTELCGLYGQVLHSGVLIDLSYDVTHASCGAIHFWPYWSQSDYVLSWTAQNADAITLGRVDGADMPDIFTLGYRSTLRFVTSPNNPPANGSAAFASRLWFGSVYADSVVYPVWINGAAQATSIFYPNNIVIDSLVTAGYGIGRCVSGTRNVAGFACGAAGMPNSYGVLVDSNGAAEIAIGHLSVEKAANAAFGIIDSRLATTARIGSLKSRLTGPVAIYAPGVGGTQQHDIAVGMKPDIDVNEFGPAGSPALVSIPRLPNYVQPLAAGQAYQYGLPRGAGAESNAELMVLAAEGRRSGVTVNLPTSPFNGQTAAIVSTVPLSAFAVTSAQPIVGAPPGSLLANRAIDYSYVAGVGWVRTN